MLYVMGGRGGPAWLRGAAADAARAAVDFLGAVGRTLAAPDREGLGRLLVVGTAYVPAEGAAGGGAGAERADVVATLQVSDVAPKFAEVRSRFGAVTFVTGVHTLFCGVGWLQSCLGAPARALREDPAERSGVRSVSLETPRWNPEMFAAVLNTGGVNLKADELLSGGGPQRAAAVVGRLLGELVSRTRAGHGVTGAHPNDPSGRGPRAGTTMVVLTLPIRAAICSRAASSTPSRPQCHSVIITCAPHLGEPVQARPRHDDQGGAVPDGEDPGAPPGCRVPQARHRQRERQPGRRVPPRRPEAVPAAAFARVQPPPSSRCAPCFGALRARPATHERSMAAAAQAGLREDHDLVLLDTGDQW